MKQTKDFLAACRRAKRDPSSVQDPEAYMRGWHIVGERIKKMRRHVVKLEKNSLLKRQAG